MKDTDWPLRCRCGAVYQSAADMLEAWPASQATPRRPPSPPELSAATVAELFPNEDPTLIGNRIAALTSAIGFPPCGGCNKRKEWLNAAHQWIRTHLFKT